MSIESLGQVSHGKVKVVADENESVFEVARLARLNSTVGLGLLECRIENVQAKLVGYHVPLDTEQTKLHQVHCAILFALGAEHLLEDGLFCGSEAERVTGLLMQIC